MFSATDLREINSYQETLMRDVIGLIEDIDDDLERIPRPYIAEDLEGHFLDLYADLAALSELKQEYGLYDHILRLQPSWRRRVESVRKKHTRLRHNLREIYDLLATDRHVRHLHRRLGTWLSRFRDLDRAEQELVAAASQHVSPQPATDSIDP